MSGDQAGRATGGFRLTTGDTHRCLGDNDARCGEGHDEPRSRFRLSWDKLHPSTTKLRASNRWGGPPFAGIRLNGPSTSGSTPVGPRRGLSRAFVMLLAVGCAVALIVALGVIDIFMPLRSPSSVRSTEFLGRGDMILHVPIMTMYTATAAPGSEHRLERDLVYSFDPQRSFDGLRPRMEAPVGAGRYSPLRPEYDILGSERGGHWTERDSRRVFVLSGGDMRPRMYRAWPRTESGWPRCGRRRPRNLEDDVRDAQCDRDLRSGS